MLLYDVVSINICILHNVPITYSLIGTKYIMVNQPFLCITLRIRFNNITGESVDYLMKELKCGPVLFAHECVLYGHGPMDSRISLGIVVCHSFSLLHLAMMIKFKKKFSDTSVLIDFELSTDVSISFFCWGLLCEIVAFCY